PPNTLTLFALSLYFSSKSIGSSGFKKMILSKKGKERRYKKTCIVRINFVLNGRGVGCSVKLKPSPSSIPILLGTFASFAANVPKTTGLAKYENTKSG